MKKLLIVASIGLLLVEQFGFASNSKYSAARSKKSNVSSKMNGKKVGGNGERLATALGVNLEDLKVSGYGLSGWRGWTDKSLVVCEKDSKGDCKRDAGNAIIERKLTAEELDDQKIDQTDRVMNYYRNKFKSKALDELHKDIQAFQALEQFKSITRENLKEKITSLVATAEDAGQALYRMSVDDRLTDLLSHRFMHDALEEAQLHLNLAMQSRNEDEIALYKDVMQEMQAIQNVLESLKKAHRDPVKVAKSSLMNATAQDDFDKIDIYTYVIAQLELEAAEAKKINDHVDSLIHDAGRNPLKALEIARKELGKDQKELFDLNRQNNLQAYGSRIQKLEDNLRQHEKVIEQLKMRAGRTERDADVRVEELIQKYGNAEQALDRLLHGQQGSSYFSKVFVWDSKSAQNDLINKISNVVDKEAAKILQQKIQEGSSSGSSFSMNFSSGSGSYAAPRASDNSAVGNALAAAGLNAAELDRTAKGRALKNDLINILEDGSKKLRNIAESKQLPAQQKQDFRQSVSQEMSTAVADKIAVYKGGVSLGTLATGDASSIGTELASNYLIDQLRG